MTSYLKNIPQTMPMFTSVILKERMPKVPNEPSCEPAYKWNGPSELLIDPNDVTGLIFNVKGMSAHGSIVIRQDPQAKDYINVTNRIYLSEESLQTEVDIKIDIIDEDYSITIEAPSFDGLGKVDFSYVSLKTRNGHIKFGNLSAATAEIATINGHVHGSYIVSESLDIRTVNGAIDIDVGVNALAEDISITTKSINGHLNISVFNLTEDQTINLKAGSVNGGAITSLPEVYAGDFYVTTLIGYAYVEGHNITYTKNLRNSKVGYKNKKDEDEDSYHKNYHRSEDSHVTLEAVTGSVE
ncbi:16550_t:CDS:2, partial [Acaulospora colombiana]